MWLLRPPGVYPPQDDTRLLAEAMAYAGIRPGAHVLDVCTGTGALAVAAARAGAGEVTAVDRCRRAVFAAWANGRAHRVRVRARHGDFGDLVGERRFDVVTANPPYVPSQDVPDRGPARAWDAGERGRAVLDRLCAVMPLLLAERGIGLIVHSGLCGEEATLHQLRGGGLKASVVARRTVPFGPVMRGRARWLEDRGLIAPGQRHEELVVIRADRADAAA
ncbi:HemK2/MTQ2 family protein methyltransferase [Saccharothrix coeruleofusca]|uniref:Methyltransferase n=1 Tax=Saccharothrix coeruleofusca TaxID=33919 RepID=A0A918AT90_9PSEU|nr:HemK2/MTQ2 family protein methyltransferase [Saccharothrix coeruleofusca]MBP2336868.1 release factor glutamine methyltransferase [Saccharothrix coeruleofusca]GGP82190.1 methyltransferase [Saccharothrix coeruleofusca]